MARATIDFALRAQETPVSPIVGALGAIVEFSSLLPDGTTAGKIDLVSKTTLTIGGTANADTDMRALLDVLGVAMGTLTEIVAIVFEAAPANAGLVSIKPAASNGWLGLLADATDVLKLQPGATVILYCPGDGRYTVGASTDTINLANAGATAATVTLTILGRSA